MSGETHRFPVLRAGGETDAGALDTLPAGPAPHTRAGGGGGGGGGQGQTLNRTVDHETVPADHHPSNDK